MGTHQTANAVLDRVQARHAQIARLQAAQHEDVERMTSLLGDSVTASELAPGLTLTRWAAGVWVDRASALCSLPRMFHLLKVGLIDEWRVRVVHQEMSDVLTLDDPRWATIDAAAARVAPGMDSGKLKRFVHRLLITIDPDAAEKERVRALNERKVVKYVNPKGMATILADLSGEDAALVMATLHAIADLAPKDDPRTRKQLLADAFAALFLAVSEGRPLDLIPTPTPPVDPPEPDYARIPEQWVKPDHDEPDHDPDHRGSDHAGSDHADAVEPAAECPSGLPSFVPDLWKPPGLGTQQGSRLRLVLHMDAETLAFGGDVPGFLVTHGSITPAAARDLARQCDSVDLVIRPEPEKPATCRGTGRKTRRGSRDRPPRRAAPSTGSPPTGSPSTGSPSTGSPPTGSPPPLPPGRSQRPRRARVSVEHVHHPHAGDYRPRQDLIRQVIAHNPHCRAPGCSRPAVQCQLDHVEEWPTGLTCLCNLAPLCRFHHQLKTTGFVDYRLYRDGAITWTTALGRDYHLPPPDDLHG